MSFADDKALMLGIAAEKLGLDKLDESACGFEKLGRGHRGEIWRVIVVGDGKAPTFDPTAAPAASVETRTVEVTERDLHGAER